MTKITKSSPLKMAPQIYGGTLSNIDVSTSLGASAATITNSISIARSVNSSSVNWVQPVRGNTLSSRDDSDYIDVDLVKTCRPVYTLEKHMTVVRRGPTAPPVLEMYKWEDDKDIQNDLIDPDGLIVISTSFAGDQMPTGTGVDGSDISIFYAPTKEILKIGDEVILPIDLATGGPGGKPLDWNNGYILEISHSFFNSFNVLQKAVARVAITDNPLTAGEVVCTILSISENFPITGTTGADIYEVRAEQTAALFKYKFVKFCYRYKYEDGEYSVFSPWSEIAFMPSKFEYMPKHGYNLGMVNEMRTLKVKNWRPKSLPEDVVEIDLLYKESNSPNIYTVETFKKNDPATVDNPCADNIYGAKVNHWNACGTGENFGNYTVTSELIYQVVPSNQLLRPWDNVPRKALAQEVSASRLIYANYLEGYDVLDKDGQYIKPEFGRWIDTEDLSITGGELGANNYQSPGEPMKSLKSMRTYQLGVVYRDRYGRETPVLTSESGTVTLPIANAKTQNRLNVQINSPAPDWAESYTFYIKETSNEYYNLAMDRWYNAKDGGIWLSFPSSERNKIMDDNEGSGQSSTRSSFLILKKQHNSDRHVESENRYKILSVKNSPPEYIKTEYKFWGTLPMMLPPPGWGEGGKPGGWDTGMFHVTGLPLPNRLFLDVYAEYWDQSVLAGLTGTSEGGQVRMVQTKDQPAAYNASPSSAVNKSKWYDVAKVSYIGSEAQTYIQTSIDNAGNTIEEEVEVPGQAEQIVRITLEEIMGDDMAFCEPPSSSTLALNKGLALEVRTKVVRDRAQFQGRFFVKILRDPIIQTNIVETTQAPSDFYQVLMARDIRYISAAHPGTQEARTGVSGTTGAGGGSWYGFEGADRNFLPVAKAWGGSDPDRKYEVSSLSDRCIRAEYEGPTGNMVVPDEDANGNPYLWPYGPTQLANYMLVSGWWYNHYNDYVNNNISIPFGTHRGNYPRGVTDKYMANTVPGGGWALGPIIADEATNPSVGGTWPSFLFNKWEPRTCHPDSGSVNSPCDSLVSNQFLTGDYNGGIDLTDIKFGPTPSSDPDKGMFDLQGVNAFMVPAIWGDQSDLLGYTGNPDSSPTNLNLTTDVSGISQTFASVWDKDTIVKLRKDWYYLYFGRDKISKDWPLGRHAPNRWFIDKVGAAGGYSGNGIWTNEDGVSMISMSYYGIGSSNRDYRSHNLLLAQQAEHDFATMLMTIGTQFRFKDDPHQVVYTITNVGETETVYNYEARHGSWGYADLNPDGSYNPATGAKGGGSMGSKKLPPWGAKHTSDTSIAGKAAFISDLFTSSRTKTGGAVYNYRLRITLTLDKEIGTGTDAIPLGTAGIGFHPLLNHVDIDGNCNIQEGPQTYWDGLSGTAPDGWIGGSKLSGCQDVLPTPAKFYNLSSYWNYTGGGAPSGQGSTMGNGDTDGQHFGLHERGLNSTVIEIITPYRGDETRKEMSNNPAVFETEPMEDVGLDIYYAASPTYPIDVRRFRDDENRPDDTDFAINGARTNAHLFDYGLRGEEIIPVGAKVNATAGPNAQAGDVYNNWVNVVAVQGDMIWVDNPLVFDSGGNGVLAKQGDVLKFVHKGEGEWYGANWDNYLYYSTVNLATEVNVLKIDSNTHNKMRTLPYFNCYTFSNGVESNRIRDDYNAVTIDKGVKASAPLAEQYKQERKPSSLIFSGIYNSTSGVNRTNQFIQAEPITKDLNPINGSIQKLFARDTDLVTFCENKVFKILANKDALFNADGNTNVTSNAAVLGQAIPFVGEYGISRNPESLASESYRLYFSDKDRGAMLRLSRDGITPISDAGMSNWFKDNLKYATSIIGSFDKRKDEYNVTIETSDRDNINETKAYTLSFTEKSRGWISFKSFIHQGGITYKNVYYTFPSNVYSNLTEFDPFGIPYSDGNGDAEIYEHALDLRVTRNATAANSPGDSIIKYSNDPNTVVIEGMNVEGNGIQHGTTVAEVISPTRCRIVLPNGDPSPSYLDSGEEIIFTTPRNRFYKQNHYSMLRTVFNRDQGSVKTFRTINYEGSQAKIIPSDSNGPQISNRFRLEGTTLGLKYLDDFEKQGWYVNEIKTDLQKGSVKEFVDKENKWFDYIRGEAGNQVGDELDTGNFSLQGIGFFTSDNSNIPTNQA